MLRRLAIAAAAAAFCVPALAQMQVPLGKSATGMIGTWEFSDAARHKVCRLTFKDERGAVGLALAFGAGCAKLFPLVRDVVGWKYPDDDLLYLLNAQGKALVAFSAGLALIAAGCGGGSTGTGSSGGDANSPVTMTFWHNSTTGDGKQYWEDTVAAFEKEHSNVTIN